MCFKTENDVANQLPLLTFSSCWYHWVQLRVHISEFTVILYKDWNSNWGTCYWTKVPLKSYFLSLSLSACVCAQWLLTLFDLMDCTAWTLRTLQPAWQLVHGILQARILEWIAISSSRGIFPTQGQNLSLQRFLHWQADSLPLSLPGKSVYLHCAD